MKKMKFAFVACLAMVLSACGGVVNVAKPYQAKAIDAFNYKLDYLDGVSVSEAGLNVLEPYLESQLSDQGKLAKDDDPNAKTINIIFNKYRMRHGATRHFAGVFAGADTIDTTVLIKDKNGEILGETQVTSSNASAWGTATGLIKGHVDKIIEFISSGG